MTRAASRRTTSEAVTLTTNSTRRSIYLPMVRNALPDVLALFDMADPNCVATVRDDTTVPTQALFLMNNPFVRQQAQHLAQRLLAEEKADDAARGRRAFALVLNRPPTDQEIGEATLHTGDGVFARPSMGAWTLYGLGSENQDLPGFIVLAPSLIHGGTQNYGVAFLPASFQGLRIGDGFTTFQTELPPNMHPADDPALQRLQLNLVRQNNQRHRDRSGDDARFDARMEAFELAFRMQMAAPTALDTSGETKETFALYGIGTEPTDEFGRMCLLARRFAERGVRFVQVCHSFPRNYWDAHGDLKNNHASNARKVDQPIAGLLTDLKGRGLLNDTLVIFGTEFGRTPASQGKEGRDFRLTDVHGNVVREIIA